jgi:hypothetical protein
MVPSILARPIGVSALIIAPLTRAAITKTAIGAALVASEIWPVEAAEIPVTSVTTAGILIGITATAEAPPGRCVVPKLTSPVIASNVATTTIIATIGVAAIVAALTTTVIF